MRPPHDTNPVPLWKRLEEGQFEKLMPPLPMAIEVIADGLGDDFLFAFERRSTSPPESAADPRWKLSSPYRLFLLEAMRQFAWDQLDRPEAFTPAPESGRDRGRPNPIPQAGVALLAWLSTHFDVAKRIRSERDKRSWFREVIEAGLAAPAYGLIGILEESSLHDWRADFRKGIMTTHAGERSAFPFLWNVVQPAFRPSAWLSNKTGVLDCRTISAKEVDDLFIETFYDEDHLVEFFLEAPRHLTADDPQAAICKAFKSRIRNAWSRFVSKLKSRETREQVVLLPLIGDAQELLRLDLSEVEMGLLEEDPQHGGRNAVADLTPSPFSDDFGSPKHAAVIVNRLAASRYDDSLQSDPVVPLGAYLAISAECSDSAFGELQKQSQAGIETLAWLLRPVVFPTRREYWVPTEDDEDTEQPSPTLTKVASDSCTPWAIWREDAITEEGRIVGVLIDAWWLPGKKNPTYLGRVGNALRFANEARSQSSTGLRFTLLTTALEALLGSKGEVTAKIAQRSSVVLEPNRMQRSSCSRKIKDLYNTRSRIVHGDEVNASEADAECLQEVVGSVLLTICRHLLLSFRMDGGEVKRKSLLEQIDHDQETGQEFPGSEVGVVNRHWRQV